MLIMAQYEVGNRYTSALYHDPKSDLRSRIIGGKLFKNGGDLLQHPTLCIIIFGNQQIQ